MSEKPYIETTRVIVDRKYNPEYGDNRVCQCGHPYYRHFDSYEEMRAIGCKYCGCFLFIEGGECPSGGNHDWRTQRPGAGECFQPPVCMNCGEERQDE